MGALTDVAGLLVGQAEDAEGLTGVTVVLCPQGAMAAVDVCGGAPGTLGTELLRSENLAERIDGVALCGGSIFGLAAVAGVLAELRQRGWGMVFGGQRIPNVPAAVVFDLGLGRADRYPDAALGRAACRAAGRLVAEGCVGAGIGVSVGKVLGIAQATKSGVGTASERLATGLVVGALVVNNAVGDIVEPGSGRIVAGARLPEPVPPALAALAAEPGARPYPGAGRLLRLLRGSAPPPANTTLAVVATNASLDRAGCQRLAIMAQTGLARAIWPVQTPSDGDTVFALATGQLAGPVDALLLGAVAAEVMVAAVLRSVRQAWPLGGLPAAAG
jgi:L-aminopeptidase/D-esterase-like protein